METMVANASIFVVILFELDYVVWKHLAGAIISVLSTPV